MWLMWTVDGQPGHGEVVARHVVLVLRQQHGSVTTQPLVVMEITVLDQAQIQHLVTWLPALPVSVFCMASLTGAVEQSQCHTSHVIFVKM